MPDRRNWERFPPQFSNEEEAVIVFEGHKISGAVSNLSQGGICVIVMGDAGIPLGETVALSFQGRTAEAVVRNVTSDVVTFAYGMEWSSGPIPVI